MGGRGSRSRMNSGPRASSTAGGLADIKSKYKNDVDYLFMHESNGTVFLDNVVVKDKGKGTGQRILDDIIDYADSTGQRVALTPTSEFGTKSRLEKWYKKNGFVKNSGRNADMSLSETMYRPARRR